MVGSERLPTPGSEHQSAIWPALETDRAAKQTLVIETRVAATRRHLPIAKGCSRPEAVTRKGQLADKLPDCPAI